MSVQLSLVQLRRSVGYVVLP